MAASTVAKRWLAVIVGWGLIALLAVVQIWLARAAAGHPPPVWQVVLLEVPIWMFWAAATVAIVVFLRRWPLGGPSALSGIAFHLGASGALAVGFVAFHLLWYQAFNPYPLLTGTPGAWFWRSFRDHFIDGVVLYWAVVGIYHAFTNYARYRDKDLEASAARHELAEARLQVLRMQLRPHFLFNSLNTASAILESNPKGARRIIGKLGELLRASLNDDGRSTTSLREEIELVLAYLELEQTRFGDRLGVSVAVPPSLATARVPSFLLQPLVENAIRHGIAPRPGPGVVSISARQEGGDLTIDVEDDGLGLPRARLREGVGLGNTKRRLRELYGRPDLLTLAPRATGGLLVQVRVPQ